ncbi:MAG: hypothetical protein ACO1OB_00975 [Archangium sp.]
MQKTWRRPFAINGKARYLLDATLPRELVEATRDAGFVGYGLGADGPDYWIISGGFVGKFTPAVELISPQFAASRDGG